MLDAAKRAQQQALGASDVSPALSAASPAAPPMSTLGRVPSFFTTSPSLLNLNEFSAGAPGTAGGDEEVLVGGGRGFSSRRPSSSFDRRPLPPSRSELHLQLLAEAVAKEGARGGDAATDARKIASMHDDDD